MTRFVVLIAVARLLAGCSQQASEISLDELARNPMMYHGYRVSAAGELRSHPDPLHYWIESSSGTRVEVNGLENPDVLLGTQLWVTGTFRYSRDKGRRIEVTAQERQMALED